MNAHLELIIAHPLQHALTLLEVLRVLAILVTPELV
jgi:hypothetical protein